MQLAREAHALVTGSRLAQLLEQGLQLEPAGDQPSDDIAEKKIIGGCAGTIEGKEPAFDAFSRQPDRRHAADIETIAERRIQRRAMPEAKAAGDAQQHLRSFGDSLGADEARPLQRFGHQ